MILLEYKPLYNNEFGEEIPPTVYKKNEKYMELAKDNCKRCHGRGFELIQFPRRFEKKQTCGCVENSLVRAENAKALKKDATATLMTPNARLQFLASFNKE